MSLDLTVLKSISSVKVLTDIASCFRWMSPSTEYGTVCGTERRQYIGSRRRLSKKQDTEGRCILRSTQVSTEAILLLN